jgi:hypothetical protein
MLPLPLSTDLEEGIRQGYVEGIAKIFGVLVGNLANGPMDPEEAQAYFVRSMAILKRARELAEDAIANP